ncbi:MAG: hypothetical protein ACLGQX_08700 [Acidobacteriota bacterium]
MMLTWMGLSEGARSPHRAGFARFTLHTLAVIALMGMGMSAAWAQSPAPGHTPAGSAAAYPAQSSADFGFAVPAGDQLFSSSSEEQTASLAMPAETDFSAALLPQTAQPAGAQPAGATHSARPAHRRRYFNGEDSNKVLFYAGTAATFPVGGTSSYLTPNWTVQGGVGPWITHRLAVAVEFDWDQFGLTKTALDNQLAIYNYVYGYLYGLNTAGNRMDGGSLIWSFSLQPQFILHSSSTMEVYAKAGAGLYFKSASFILPVSSCTFTCPPYDFRYFRINAPGYDGGLGMAFKAPTLFKIKPPSKLKLYVEGRFIYIDHRNHNSVVNTPASLASINSNINTFYPYISASSIDFFPADAESTMYFPVTVGFRW